MMIVKGIENINNRSSCCLNRGMVCREDTLWIIGHVNYTLKWEKHCIFNSKQVINNLHGVTYYLYIYKGQPMQTLKKTGSIMWVYFTRNWWIALFCGNFVIRGLTYLVLFLNINLMYLFISNNLLFLQYF